MELAGRHARRAVPRRRRREARVGALLPLGVADDNSERKAAAGLIPIGLTLPPLSFHHVDADALVALERAQIVRDAPPALLRLWAARPPAGRRDGGRRRHPLSSASRWRSRPRTTAGSSLESRLGALRSMAAAVVVGCGSSSASAATSAATGRRRPTRSTLRGRSAAARRENCSADCRRRWPSAAGRATEGRRRCRHPEWAIRVLAAARLPAPRRARPRPRRCPTAEPSAASASTLLAPHADVIATARRRRAIGPPVRGGAAGVRDAVPGRRGEPHAADARLSAPPSVARLAVGGGGGARGVVGASHALLSGRAAAPVRARDVVVVDARERGLAAVEPAAVPIVIEPAAQPRRRRRARDGGGARSRGR